MVTTGKASSGGAGVRAVAPASPWARGVPERTPGAEGLAVGSDFLVLDTEGRMLRGLNASGAAVWELIDARRPLEAMAQEIARRYSEPVPRVLEDVIAFARDLAGRGLIRILFPQEKRR